MANYSLTEFCELPAGIDAAYAQLTDAEFIRKSYENRESVQVAVEATGNGHSVIVTRPVGPQAGPLGLSLQLQQHWRDGDQGKVADVTYNLIGAPLKITGAMQLSQAGSGSTLSALLNLQLGLPLLGRLLVEKLAWVVQEKVAADLSYQRDALAVLVQ